MATKTVSLSDLSSEEIAQLKKQLKKEEAEKEKKLRDVREAYKTKVNTRIPALFTLLQMCSNDLAAAKKKVFEDLADLVEEKSEVYDREQDQASHSFSTDEGVTIIIGYRQLDGWDDTAEVGIQKVRDYLQSLGKDENSKQLVSAVLQLLSRDSKGMLKASRVLQLRKMAEQSGSKKFIDAIGIIQEAYRPTRSKQFVTCRYKDSEGNTVDLPLNITDVPMPAK